MIELMLEIAKTHEVGLTKMSQFAIVNMSSLVPPTESGISSSSYFSWIGICEAVILGILQRATGCQSWLGGGGQTYRNELREAATLNGLF